MRHTKFRVKPYRWSKSRPYVVEGRMNGKRSRRFFETKEKAKTYCELKNIEIENHGRAHAEFDSRLRDMACQCAGMLSDFGATILDATQHYIAHRKAVERSCMAVQLVSELIAAKERDGASIRHVGDLRSRLNIFANKFDGQPVAAITSAAIDDWLRSLNVSPVTRNHYRRLIVLAFNFAVQRGYATENPAKKTDKAKEHSGDIGILTITQAARLLESATPDVLPYIAIGLFAGLRRAEIERLDWSEIDFESGLIEVTAQNAKTARRRHVTLQPNLREWLLPLRKHRGPVTSEDFRRQFDQARIGAGINDWPDNGLRHSFASYHLAHFKDAKALALEMGHTNENLIFSNYRQLVKPKEAGLYWKIMPCDVGEKKIVPIAAAKKR